MPRIIWALLEAAKRVTAEKDRMDMIEDILQICILMSGFVPDEDELSMMVCKFFLLCLGMVV